MNWKNIAIGLGRVMSNMSRARRSGKARSASKAIWSVYETAYQAIRGAR